MCSNVSEILFQPFCRHTDWHGAKGHHADENLLPEGVPPEKIFFVGNMHATMVMTDSGGLREEATVLGVPCMTLRNNTERPISCEVGANFVVGNGREKILHHAFKLLKGDAPLGRVPEKWDGRAAERIVKVLRSLA